MVHRSNGLGEVEEERIQREKVIFTISLLEEVMSTRKCRNLGDHRQQTSPSNHPSSHATMKALNRSCWSYYEVSRFVLGFHGEVMGSQRIASIHDCMHIACMQHHPTAWFRHPLAAMLRTHETFNKLSTC